MDEYIKRKDAFEILQSRLDSISQMSYLNMDWHELDIMRNAIENAIDDVGEVPAVDVQPVKRGKWKYYKNNGIIDTYICTNCQGKVDMAIDVKPSSFKYCPNCGARMDGDAE